MLQALQVHTDSRVGHQGINQDYCLDVQVITSSGLHLLVTIVCDGGGKDGHLVAEMSVNEIIKSMREDIHDEVHIVLTKAIESAHQVIFSRYEGKSFCTVVIAAIELTYSPYGRLFVAHLGDSSIFLVRDNKAHRLNIDHISNNEDYGLQRAIGLSEEISVDVGIYMNTTNFQLARSRGAKGLLLVENDTILLCSDGLIDNVSDITQTEDEIVRISYNQSPQIAALELFSNLENERLDDASLALIFVPGDKRQRRISSNKRPGLFGLAVAAIQDLLTSLSSFSDTSQSLPESTQRPLGEVEFTAYSPIKTIRGARYGLVVYIAEPSVRKNVMVDSKKFSDEFGILGSKERSASGTYKIMNGAEVEVVPECEGVIFSPTSLKKIWSDKWIRYNFDFIVPEKYPHYELHFRISIQIKGFEIASINASSEINPNNNTDQTQIETNSNPLFDAQLRGNLQQTNSNTHKHVFISYSHEDSDFALRHAQEIETYIGDKVFIDVKHLRAGDDWQYRLANAIDNADIFQLLWSENSANSDWCRYEWEYAMAHKCADNMCIGVIRPIYWEKPMPTPPKELEHLHFQHIHSHVDVKNSNP